MTTPTITVPRLRELRQAAGLAQEDVARRAACSSSTIRNAEHGLRVSEPMAVRIAGALGCAVEELRGDVEALSTSRAEVA